MYALYIIGPCTCIMQAAVQCAAAVQGNPRSFILIHRLPLSEVKNSGELLMKLHLRTTGRHVPCKITVF